MVAARDARAWAASGGLRGIGDSLYTPFSGADGDDIDWDAYRSLVRYCVEGPIDAEIARLYFAEFHNRREAEAMPRFDSLRRAGAGVRSAAELDHAGFFRSALYNEIWRPQGLFALQSAR